MPSYVEMDISHMCYSIGGEHHYAKLWDTTKCETTEVRRKLDDPKEVEYLIEKDGDDYHRLGMKTGRFNGYKHAREHAVRVFEEEFTANDVLFYVDSDIREDDKGKYHVDYHVLLRAPEEFREGFSKLDRFDIGARFKFLDEMGYGDG